MTSEGLEGEHDSEDRGPVRVHEPVLPRETLEALGLEPGMTVVDGTAGAFGHGRLIAKALGPGGIVVGMDRDAEILAHARESLRREASDSRERAGVRFFHARFSEMASVLELAGLDGCDRVLLDLGVSSLHLDSPQRGFSFMHDAELDMRMDAEVSVTAADWLADVAERELARVLFAYGDERHARRIARAVVEARRRGAMTRTSHLVDAIMRGLPPRARRQRIHPATRTFQAVRMAVNDEVGELERGLEAALQCLRAAGRLVVISFHSVEDRAVKHFVRARMTPLYRKPVTAGAEELRRNPRARSAKLRCGIVRVA